MNTYQSDVARWEVACGGDVPAKPGTPSPEVRALRAKLIAEEAAETVQALGFDVDLYVWSRAPDGEREPVAVFVKDAALSMAEVADGIVDTIWVLLGTAVAYGVDLDPLWAEVRRANFAKVDGPVRPDGKRMKPDGWQPPDIAGALAEQRGAL